MSTMSRACPQCWATNPATATFCEKCGTRLIPEPAQASGLPPPPSAGAPAPPAWAGRPGMPQPAIGRPLPQPRTKSSAGWAIGLLVALVAGGITWFLLNRGIGFPDEIAGHPRNDSDIAQAVVDTVETGAAGAGVEFEVAAYGTDAAPAFMVMVIEEAPSLPGFFDTFIEGAATGAAGQGASIDTADIVHQDRGSASYACVPIEAAPPLSSLCGWSDEDTTGLVISFVQHDLTESFGLAEEIRDAIEG